MEVILLERVGKLGNLGDRVAVKSGYARNFLIPFGKAAPATATNVAQLEAKRAELERAAQERQAAAEARAATLAAVVITMAVNASDEGRLFGSIGTRDIAEAIVATGNSVEKSEVRLPNGPVRELGEHQIALQLHNEVMVEIKLVVVRA